MRKDCHIYRAINFVGKRWTLLILLELYKGNSTWKRYSELKNRLLDITPKILSSRLNELKKEGLIIKKISSVRVPISSNYRLTKKGEDFVCVIKEMKKWSLRWNSINKCADDDCKHCQF